ncbi:MAG TPA: glycosyltransferase, partial [Bacteroidia bacterium]|nr:glycosyltransferase [Bacteroidia bacterium]
NLSMLFKLAYNGIFNFSEIPIKFISRLGILSIIVSMGYLAMVLFKKFFSDQVPTGFTALIVAIVLFSGVQLISIGIIGEYVLRIFFQVKQRPIFLLKSKIEDGNEQTSSPVAQTNSNV